MKYLIDTDWVVHHLRGAKIYNDIRTKPKKTTGIFCLVPRLEEMITKIQI